MIIIIYINLLRFFKYQKSIINKKKRLFKKLIRFFYFLDNKKNRSDSSNFLSYFFSSDDWMVFVGDRSYAMYLWHWPFLVFMNTILNSKDNLGMHFFPPQLFLLKNFFLLVVIIYYSYHYCYYYYIYLGKNNWAKKFLLII